MLLWLLPPGLDESRRAGLADTPSSGLTGLAVHHAHHDRWPEALHHAFEASRDPSRAGDLARLTLAGLHIEQGDTDGGLTLIRQVTPFLELNRPALCTAHLLTAFAALRRGEARVADAAAARAESLASVPATRSLRLAALCARALAWQARGDDERAGAQAARAARLANTPLSGFLAASTLARVLCSRRPYDAMQAADRAEHFAPTEQGRAAARAAWDQAYARLQGTDGPASPPPASHVHLQVLGSPAIHLQGSVLDASRQPRTVLLLTYALVYPGRPLNRVAEQLLPETATRRVQYHDEAHRVARLRQDIQRARQLLGDPSAVICHGGAVTLSSRYRWSSDLHDAIRAGRVPSGQILGSLDCDWLDFLRSNVD